MQDMYKKNPPVMPPRNETNDPAYDAWPAALIHKLFEQQHEMEVDLVTGRPVVPTTYKTGYKFNDVPLIQVKGASGRSEIVPFWKRKASLTRQSLVSPVFAIGFSISDKTGQLVLNLSIHMMHYVGENTPLGAGDSVEDVLKYDVSAINYFTVPAACLSNPSSVPRIEEMPPQAQIAAAAAAASPVPESSKRHGATPDVTEQPAFKRPNAS